MNSELYQKTFFTIIFLALIAVSFLIVKPFFTAVVAGIIMSYIFHPLYRVIHKKISNKNIASSITSIMVVLIITLPLFFILDTISKDAYTTYLLSKQKSVSIQFTDNCQPAEKIVCKITSSLAAMLNKPQVKYYVDTIIKDFTNKITENISGLLLSIPFFLMNVFIMLFVMFFIFRDAYILLDKLERILPLKSKYRKHVFKRLNDMAHAVIYGSIIIAIVQGILGGMGFLIFGLPSPLLWGVVMIFASLIPYVGSSIIWFPAALTLILDGYVNFKTVLIIKGLLLILYGIFVVGTMDNILKPKIIGSRSGLHPVLVLLGVVGGLKLFGFIGIVVGPITLSMLVAFIKIYEEEKNKTKS
ncbi:AI-2E family transporter [Candidatus Woesearchaeota archaeon]|nr:AI-2E family transporter [Candidatus Woesearchaeota archaeon]